MKKGERGQISIFIIIGILLVFIFIGLFYLYKSKDNKDMDLDYFSSDVMLPQLENIEANILMCNDIVGRKALKAVGLRGGYYKQPVSSLIVEKSFLPYYYDEGKMILPTEATVKTSLEGYSDDNLQKCYDMLKFEGFILSNTLPRTMFLINDKKVVMHADSDFTIKSGDKSIIFSTKEHDITYSSELKNILGVARSFTLSHKDDPKMFCISCIEKELLVNDLYLRSRSIKDDSELIIIAENHTDIEPYAFTFLNKYTGEEKSNDENLTGGKAQALPNNP